MIIGVNARFLLFPYTGIGQYTRYLFAALARQNPELKIIMGMPVSSKPIVPFQVPNIEIIEIPEIAGHKGVAKTFWEQVQLPKALKQRKADLMFFPYPANPWIKIKTPTIVTVHDAIPWTMPEYRKSLLTRFYQNRAQRAVLNADLVLSVSQSAADEITTICGLKKNAIKVIYNALSEQLYSPVDQHKKAQILHKYGIDPQRNFLLYLGGYDHRKNVTVLVQAYQNYVAKYHKLDLILAGGATLKNDLNSSYQMLTKLTQKTSVSAEKGHLQLTGFIEAQDLPALYQSSYAFINLSLAEGFNLPALEAIANHAPTILSDIPVHRELYAGSAELVPADNQQQITEKINLLIEDKNYYQTQKKRVSQAVIPSWEAAAKDLIKAINKIV